MSPKMHRTSPKMHRTSPQIHKTSPKTHITSPHHCRCPCCPWCYQHWPVLHEGAGLFIQLLPLPCSFLSSSRADPSKMHFRWRRDSLLGASNLCQVCFYWLQEHTDAGKADRLQHLMSLLSPQMFLILLEVQKRRKAAFLHEREIPALLWFCVTAFVCLACDIWALHWQGMVPHWLF